MSSEAFLNGRSGGRPSGSACVSHGRVLERPMRRTLAHQLACERGDHLENAAGELVAEVSAV